MDTLKPVREPAESGAERRHGVQEQLEALAAVAKKLDDLIFAAQIPPDDLLWTAADAAEYLRVGMRQVAERYSLMPDFPAAIYLPTPTGGKAVRRWKAAEVMQWAEGRQAKKRRRNGTSF